MVRAKFKVDGVSEVPDSGHQITMSAVTSGSEENEAFFRATPAGSLTFQCVHPEAAAQFEAGQEYYLDISPAG